MATIGVLHLERLTFDRIRIEGVSRSGQETWFRIRPPGLAFDVGRGHPSLSSAADLFVSHAHLDHALGVPFVLSVRTQQQQPTRVFCPVEAVEGLGGLITAAEAMEEIDYEYELIGLEAKDSVVVGKGLEVEAFAVDHRIPGLGFHLWQTSWRLRNQFAEASSGELVELKRRGVSIERESRRLWLSYCGDTGPQVLEREERLFDASILILECTFLQADDASRAAQYRHIHLDDLVRRRGRFRNDELILHHWSSRYRCSTVRQQVLRALAGVAPRVHLFGCGAEGQGEAS